MRHAIPAGLLALVLLAPAARADELRITANALSDGRAMLTVDGQPRMLRVGQTSPEGIKLLSANAHEAVIEVGGKRLQLQPGREPGGGFTAPERRKVSLTRAPNGHYFVGAVVDGHPLSMMLDTGATVIAISGVDADRLGVDYRGRGSPTQVMTAAGPSAAWDVVLDKVELSGILVRNVPAVVIEGRNPSPALLGMSWLQQVSMHEEGGVMVLQER